MNRSNPVRAAGTLDAKGARVARFSFPMRVYYQHTDAGGVVYHAAYLGFMEAARMEWLVARGVDVRELAVNESAQLVVYSLAIQYHRPARVNDRLEVTVDPVSLGRVRMELDQRVLLDGDEIVTAGVHAVCVHTRTLKPLPLPRSLRDRLLDGAGSETAR
jgi:tol-pal system-associated acyl-CoA thioesterase